MNWGFQAEMGCRGEGGGYITRHEGLSPVEEDLVEELWS